MKLGQSLRSRTQQSEPLKDSLSATHQIGGVFGPHVGHQAVLAQSPLKGDLDPSRVALLQLKVDVGLVLGQFGRFCRQLHRDNNTNIQVMNL